MDWGDYQEARFTLALIASLVALVALFTRFMDQDHYLHLQEVILGLYAAHSLLDDKLRDRRAPPGGA